MAGFNIVDGTNAAIDINITIASTATSVKCIFGRWTATMERQFFEATTFCSSGWRSRIPGMKQLLFSLIGFVSVGNAMSDPLVLFGVQGGFAFVLTAFTGATYTGTGQAVRDVEDLVAALSSGRTFDAESTGPVTTAWPIT